MNLHKENEHKRQRVLEELKQICNALNIKEYDYEIIELTEDGLYTNESLYLNGMQIRCSLNNREDLLYIVIEYAFIKSYCTGKI